MTKIDQTLTSQENSSANELADIRKALEIAEEARFSSSSLTTKQNKELEQASLVLRDRERELISIIGKEIAQSIKGYGTQLDTLSKTIRERTKKMSKTTQSLNKVKKALLMVSNLSKSLF